MCAATIARSERSPLRYTIDAAAQLIIIELLSIEDGAALLTALRDIRTDPDFCPSFDVCVDCNLLREIPSCEDVKRLARLCVECPRSGSTSRWALVATWRPIYDAARFFATVVSAPNRTLRVFHAWSDVRVWLGTTMPPGREDVPWIGPSRALNELIRRSGVVRR